LNRSKIRVSNDVKWVLPSHPHPTSNTKKTEIFFISLFFFFGALDDFVAFEKRVSKPFRTFRKRGQEKKEKKNYSGGK
jgi:hypothetical protein